MNLILMNIYYFIKSEVLDLLVTAMEKFHWDPTDISNYIKVNSTKKSISE